MAPTDSGIFITAERSCGASKSDSCGYCSELPQIQGSAWLALGGGYCNNGLFVEQITNEEPAELDAI
jgi:hypothetical protein